MGDSLNSSIKTVQMAAGDLKLNDTTRDVLYKAKANNQIISGTNAALKALIRKHATCVFVATDSNKKDLIPIVESLASQCQIPVLKSTMNTIAEASGLCKYKSSGEVAVKKKCMTAVLTIPSVEAKA